MQIYFQFMFAYFSAVKLFSFYRFVLNLFHILRPCVALNRDEPNCCPAVQPPIAFTVLSAYELLQESLIYVLCLTIGH